MDPHGDSCALSLLRRTKQKKALDGIAVCLDVLVYLDCVKVASLLKDIKKMVVMDKPTDKKIPYQQIACLEFLMRCLRNDTFNEKREYRITWDGKGCTLAVAKICEDAIQSSYPKEVRNAAKHTMALLIARSRVDESLETAFGKNFLKMLKELEKKH